MKSKEELELITAYINGVVNGILIFAGTFVVCLVGTILYNVLSK